MRMGAEWEISVHDFYEIGAITSADSEKVGIAEEHVKRDYQLQRE